jgi:hypothetical protein
MPRHAPIGSDLGHDLIEPDIRRPCAFVENIETRCHRPTPSRFARPTALSAVASALLAKAGIASPAFESQNAIRADVPWTRTDPGSCVELGLSSSRQSVKGVSRNSLSRAFVHIRRAAFPRFGSPYASAATASSPGRRDERAETTGPPSSSIGTNVSGRSFEAFVEPERQRSSDLGGRSVFGWETDIRNKGSG